MNRRRLLLMMGGSFTPRTIPGLELWLDATDLSTLYQDAAKTTPVTADGHPVGCWADKSGNGADCTSVGAARPLYKVIDNRPCIASDGINDQMVATITARATRTVFLVCKKTKMAVVGSYNVMSFGGNTQFVSSFASAANAYRSNGITLGGDVFFDYSVITLTINTGDAANFYINNLLLQSWALDAEIHTSTALNLFWSGSTSFGEYEIYGLLSYNRVLNSGEQKAVVSYLTAHHQAVYLSGNPFWNTIWTRVGNVIVPAAGADDWNVAQEPTVIYDNNPQILAGPNVYKMWFSQGGFGHASNICYAESDDGITWTRLAGNVLAGQARSFVLKVVATYYMYTNGTAGKMNVYTSSDGVAWAPAATDVFPGGGVSNSHVFIDTDGIWKMLYEVGSPGQIYLATSIDGLAWVPYASNPVITKTIVNLCSIGGPCIYKVGSTYYVWLHFGTNGYLPMDFVRYKSTDLIHWTWLGYIMLRQTTDEGYGASPAQIADPNLIVIGGQIYLYYSATTDGTAVGGNMHIKLATCSDVWLTRES